MSISGGQQHRLSTSGDLHGYIQYDVELQGQRLPPRDLHVDGHRVVARWAGLRIQDDIQQVGEGVWRVLRRWTFTARARVGLLFGWWVPIREGYWMVPGVMYDGNRQGRGGFPRGGPENGWSFREDRVPVPNMAFVASAHRFGALFSSPAAHRGELGSIQTLAAGGGTLLRIRIPLHEGPRRHHRKWYLGGLAGPVTRSMSVQAGTTLQRVFHLHLGHGDPHAFGDVLHHAWRVIPRGGAPAPDWGAIARYKAAHLQRNFLLRRPDATGFVTTLGPLNLPLGNFLSGGFVGKNLEIARSLYRVGRETGSEALWRGALDVAQFFLQGRLPNGMLAGAYDLFRCRWKGSFFHRTGYSTRMMGEMASQYLALHGDAAPFGDADPAWLEAAWGVGRFFLSHQRRDGGFGKWWSAAGDLLEAGGTSSAYPVSLLVRLAESQGDSLLTAAVRAGRLLLRRHVDPIRYHGDALDSDCIDREGGVSVCEALLDLYEATDEAAFLEGARRAAGYLLSWSFCWDIPLPGASPLAKRGFSTAGGTAVSVAHHHLDPYGLAIAPLLLRLARLTGDDRWSGYATAMARYAAQLVASPQDDLGRGAHWYGLQPEQVNHTDWDYLHPGIWGQGTFKNTIAWVPALTLGALLRLRWLDPDHYSFHLGAPLSSSDARNAFTRPFPLLFSYLNPIA